MGSPSCFRMDPTRRRRAATAKIIEFDVDRDAHEVFTLRSSVSGEGRFIRQAQCPGRYGHIRLTIEPYLGLSAFRVEWKVPEEQVPSEFAEATLDAIRQALERTGADGTRLSSGLVCVIGGSYHEVDSSELAFRVAAVMAVQDALARHHGTAGAPVQCVVGGPPLAIVDVGARDAILERFREFAGEKRFRQFVAEIEKYPSNEPLRYWQEQVLEEFALHSGLAVPRDRRGLSPLFRDAIARHTLASEAVPPWCRIEALEGYCPVQGWGTCGELRWYFRAKWGSWTLSATADPTVDPIDVQEPEAGHFKEELYGDCRYDAGYMPLEEARYFIVDGLKGWLNDL